MVFICSEVKKLYVSFQGMISSRRRKDVKYRIQISEPFNFEHRQVNLPGLTAEEILVLREKAAATRLGIHLDLSDRHPTGGLSSSNSSTLIPPSSSSRQHVAPPPVISCSAPTITATHHNLLLSSTTLRTCSSQSSLRSGISRSGSMAKIVPSIQHHYQNEKAAISQGNFSLLLLDDPDVFSDVETRGRKKAEEKKPRIELPVLKFEYGGDDDDLDMMGTGLMMDLDMFELGSPISPLSPSLAQRGGR
ncbi:hypothetical protein QBC38DRAFT_88447 [Podospora fimiseda]|uniref:Uncharacterized protein n=1 Tax=Podospora fimiseda TaxID=252190 RepID=A0AAN6YMY5_9PEZI|nr:hypothetical protein QBC38DRAFT_88447 [Podospora fimiseda]